MGKLSIGVVSADIMRTGRHPGSINPFVHLRVDGKYVFSTKVKRCDHRPTYLETFVVGNTHHLALVEATLFHRTDHGEDVPLGSCVISIKRLSRGVEKVREHIVVGEGGPKASKCELLTTLLGEDQADTMRPADQSTTFTVDASGSSAPGHIVVVGRLVISLFSEELGDYGLSLNTNVEDEFIRRIRRLCFLYDRSLLRRADVLIADVRESYETVGGATPTATGASSSEYGTTFGDVLERLVGVLGPEKLPLTVQVEVEGAEDLKLELPSASPPDISPKSGGGAGTSSRPPWQYHQPSLLVAPSPQAQPNPFVVLRSDYEQMETSDILSTCDPTYNGARFVFEVLHPGKFTLRALVLSRHPRSGGADVEIGRCSMSLHCLPEGFTLPRVLPLVRDDHVTGILRLRVTSQHFGGIPYSLVDSVSKRLKQLTRFFIRYEPAALPLVDEMVQQYEGTWDNFMLTLVQRYGREPGTVTLDICVDSICSLREPEAGDDDGCTSLTGGPIGGTVKPMTGPVKAYVSLHMGDTHIRTATKTYRGFEELSYNETFRIDVARETDELRVEVIDERRDVVLGSVDLTILGVQQGVYHTRSYSIVANAGTSRARCSGRVSLTMRCAQVGVQHDVDHESEGIFTKRLLALCQVHLPQKLHRVDIAVATTEDMEGFLTKLAQEHGPEPKYLRVAATVEGIRNVGPRYVNVPIQVVLEMGLERHATRVAKAGTTDPEFHETWVMDVARTDLAIRLKVVGAASNGNEAYHIASAVVHIGGSGSEETQWVPLTYQLPEDITTCRGTIGLAYCTQTVQLVEQRHGHLDRPAAVHVSSPLGGVRDAGSFSVSPLSPIQLLTSQQLPMELSSTPLHMRGSLQAHFADEASSFTQLRMSPHTSLETFDVVLEAMVGLPPLRWSASEAPAAARTAAMHARGKQDHCSALVYVVVRRACLQGSPAPYSAMDALTVGTSSQLACQGHNDVLYQSAPVPYDGKGSCAFPGARFECRLPTTPSFEDASGGIRSFDPCVQVCVYFKWDCTQSSALTSPRTGESASRRNPHRARRLGESVVSFRSTPPPPTERTKRVAIIASAGRNTARMVGTLHLKVCRRVAAAGSAAEQQQRHACPPQQPLWATEVMEERARTRACNFLAANAPQELHVADALVADYCGREDDLMRVLTRTFSSTLSREGPSDRAKELDEEQAGPAMGTITVKDVRSLINDKNISSFGSANIYVKVKVGREKFKTKAHRGSARVIAFDESFSFRVPSRWQAAPQSSPPTTDMASSASAALPLEGLEESPLLDNGASEAVHIMVCAAGAFGKTLGETYVSLAHLQRHGSKERTHMLIGAKVGDRAQDTPAPCGLVTLVLHGDDQGYPGGFVPIDETAERQALLRLRNFFQCYDAQELSRLDLYLGPALHSRNALDAVFDRLVEQYGPEPGNNQLEVVVRQCQGTLQTDHSGGHSRPFVVLSLGISQFQTQSQYAPTEVFSIDETFTFNVGLPDQQELVVFLMDEGGSGDDHTESGRVVVSLQHVRRGATSLRRLPLIFRAGTKDAVVFGNIELCLRSTTFGVPPSSVALSDEAFEALQGRVLRLLARYAPEQLHRYDVIMGQYVGREATMMEELVAELGAEPGSYPMYVRLIGYRSPRLGSDRERRILLPAPPTAGVTNNPSNPTTCAQLRDGDTMVIKVLNNGVLVLKTEGCRVEHGVASLTSSQGNHVLTELSNIDASLLTFEVYRKGFLRKELISVMDLGVRHLVKDFSNVRWLSLFDVSEGGGALLGVLGVEVKSTAFGLPSTKRDEEQYEDVAVDITSLLRKFHPPSLRQLDVLMERAPCIATAHAELRRQYAGSDVVSTVYVTIHAIDLNVERRKVLGSGTTVPPRLDVTAIGRVGVKQKKKQTPPPLQEPQIWKAHESHKQVRCIGSLCGEIVRCDGVSIRDRHQQNGSGDGGHPLFGVLRFDVPRQAPSGASFLSLHVVEPKQKDCDGLLGVVEVSIKSLLTAPRSSFYKSEDLVSFPIVLVQQSTTAVDAYVTGSITLSVSHPACEVFPEHLQFSPDVVATMSADLVTSYYRRIGDMHRAYDPAALLSFPRTFFDTAVAGGRSSTVVPQMLDVIAEQWGPEVR